jgi:predicted small lipoprotein YifL
MAAARASALLRAGLLAGALAAAAACGKKAPLRLPEQQPTERLREIRATVREDRVTLEFRVPPRRVFPEKEPPWVLARILRRSGDEKEFAEVGTILDKAGLEFDSALTWTDDGRAPGVPLAYRIEFHDAAGHRRAISTPISLSWASVPGAPLGLDASGAESSVRLAWQAPAGAAAAVAYRVYRREAPEAVANPVGEAPVAALGLVDSRVRAEREYCYTVRAVIEGGPSPVEGPASEERCTRTIDATPPPPPAGLRVSSAGGAFLLTWEAVEAADLAGYNVYRSAGDGSFKRLTAALVEGTAFRDDLGGVAPGTRCRWAVTAVDTAPLHNESSLSSPVEATAPGGEGR